MNKHLLSPILTLLIFCWTSMAAASLSNEQMHAKLTGIALYNQYREAQKYLEIAAIAGDADAQYYLAQDIRRKNQYITKDAYHWYLTAALQGNIYSMIKLGGMDADLCQQIQNCQTNGTTPSQWIEEGQRVAAERADAGDTESMYLLYRITGNRDWLEKSASNGYSPAAYFMGVGDRQGEGFFLLSTQRSSAVEKWMKKSAEGNYPPGMMAYAAILADRGDEQGFNYWKEKSALAGYASAVFNYACDLAHEPNTHGLTLDLVKAYGLMSLVSGLDGGGGMQELVQDVFPKIKAKMTPAQIQEGKKFAEQWRGSHSPLSFFPDKLN